MASISGLKIIFIAHLHLRIITCKVKEQSCGKMDIHISILKKKPRGKERFLKLMLLGYYVPST